MLVINMTAIKVKHQEGYVQKIKPCTFRTFMVTAQHRLFFIICQLPSLLETWLINSTSLLTIVTLCPHPHPSNIINNAKLLIDLNMYIYISLNC